MKKNWPIITFLSRTWMLLAFTIFTNYLTLWGHVFFWVESGQRDQWGNIIWRPLTLFDLCGAILYVPGLSSAVLWVCLLFIHLRYRATIDSDVHDGTYAKDWKEIGPVHHIWVATVVFIGMFIGLCILCSALAKG